MKLVEVIKISKCDKVIRLADGSKKMLENEIALDVELIIEGTVRKLQVKCYVMDISFDLILDVKSYKV